MQTSNQMSSSLPKSKPCLTFVGVLLLLVSFAVLSLWIMQRSVNAYYLQTYHQNSPLTQLDHIAAWRKGQDIGDALYSSKAHLAGQIAQFNQHVIDVFNQDFAYTPEYKAKLEQQKLLKQQQQDLANRFTLTPNDQIFFAGDSMMQGVAPHVQKELQKHQIKSINLSKQSTGLSYPSFFNWPETIATTLQQNPNVKILAVFLGPNDPWDMQDPKTGKTLKFQTPEWAASYSERIASILNTAKEHHVSVIWITPPNMRKASLNQQMVYLNQIMQEELKKHQVLTIDSRPLVGGKQDVYNDYLVKDGQSIKMRSGDGIHFSIAGQKLLADVLLKQLNIQP